MATVEQARQVLRKHKANLLARPYVSGVGVSKLNGEGVILILLERPLKKGESVPNYLNGVRCISRVTGTIQPMDADHTRRYRPVIGGISCSGKDLGGSGTLGCILHMDGKPYFGTNRHVISAYNEKAKGVPLIQPGELDGGEYPSDAVGTCRWFSRIAPGTNLVDFALVEPKVEFENKVLEIDGVEVFPAEAEVGSEALKSGRSTELTSGEVTATEASVKIAGTDYVFDDLIVVEGSNVCAPGDSGSAVLSDRKLLGFLFAGPQEAGDFYAACKAVNIQEALKGRVRWIVPAVGMGLILPGVVYNIGE